MSTLVECVPNFSEGRDKSKVDAIVEAMKMPGVYLLDREMDSDHNRSVITLAGERESIQEAAIRGVGKAAELIDLNVHTGAHPRMGATDVVPFIPIDGVTIEDCVAIAGYVGEEIWKRYKIPVYLYESAARIPERQGLENIRRGQFEGLREEMKRDDSVFLLGEDIGLYDGSFKVTRGLWKEFGDKRVLDTPIAEEIIIGTAIGAAMSGLRPVAEMMTVNFIMVAMDQVVNAAAHIRYMFGGGTKVPLVIRTPGGGGHQLGAQHSHSHENWFAHVPGLKVVAPGTPADAKGMLKSAIRDDNPVMFIENEGTYAVKGEVPDGEHLVPLDKNEVKRPGEHITICAHSRMLIVAMDAAAELEKEGISAEVVDMRALRPLDMAPVIESVKKTSRLITVEEGWRSYGVGSEIASRVYEEAFDYLDAPVARIGAAEVPAPYNKRLEKIAFPGKADVIVTARALLGKN